MQVSSEKLKSVGLRATSQRLAVLRVFEADEDRYWNAEDVYRQATSDNQNIGRATVYRTLAQLANVGILVRSILDAESGVACYRLHGSRQHDLLVCLGCEQVSEFADDVLAARTRSVAETHEFALRRYQLTLYGYCPRCQASRDAAADSSAGA
ncbi:MAG TPA: Fur family transcriptional regulator [Polyangiaceae bacterium]|nr:Fur family transcriptional regulator [Polyangiaceae bacterium]